MIEKRQGTHLFWPEEDHPTARLYRLLGGGSGAKWTTLRKPVPGGSYQTSEWNLSFIGLRGGAQPSSPASDDELFHQAAAKVDHKIRIDRKILGGAPCVAGTRIPVYGILQLVEAGYSHKRILKSFPSLIQEDLEAALRFSAILMER